MFGFAKNKQNNLDSLMASLGDPPTCLALQEISAIILMAWWLFDFAKNKRNNLDGLVASLGRPTYLFGFAKNKRNNLDGLVASLGNPPTCLALLKISRIILMGCKTQVIKKEKEEKVVLGCFTVCLQSSNYFLENNWISNVIKACCLAPFGTL